MSSPLDLTWTELTDRRRRTWPLSDVLVLKTSHMLQRAVELWKRRPSDSQRSVPAIVRRRCADLVARLPLFDRNLTGWRDVLALDIRDEPQRALRVEQGIRVALADAKPAAFGDGIVMVIPSLGVGGAEGQMSRLALALKRGGRSIRVAAKHSGEERFDFHRARLIAAGIPVEQIVEPRSEIGIVIPPIDANLHRLTRALVAQFTQWRPAVVHAWMDEMGAAAGLAAALCGVRRVIIDCRSLRPTWFEARGTGSIRAVLRVLSERPEVVLVNNSEAGANDYRAWLNVDCPIHVVRNAVDVMPDMGRTVRTGDRVIGGMMRLAHAKQPELWVQVAGRFLAETTNAHFVLFGDGPLRSKLERTVRSMKLENRISVEGIAADGVNALKRLDALLVTSDVEGTPNVVLEAQALGIPVVARRVGGLPEAVAPELSELLADDEAGLVAALRKALAMERDWLLQCGQAFVRREFDPTSQMEAYLALYNRAAT